MGGKSKKTVYVYTQDLKLLAAFTSTADCAKCMNLSQGNISNCCVGSLEDYKGLIFSYIPLQSQKDRDKVLEEAKDKRAKRVEQARNAFLKHQAKYPEKARKRALDYYYRHHEELKKKQLENYYRRKKEKLDGKKETLQ